jgi:O-acetyl-ADP-ribose deacetylase (regulator of RNase III)
VGSWTSPKTGKKLHALQGDITRVQADVIVNAANSRLAGGGGVDGAIHRAGGPEIMRELDGIRARIGMCAPGKAVITGAGRLGAKYVIHAVGPVFRTGREGEADLLRSCYSESLRMAAEVEARTVAFPAISTGIYGYPMEEAAEIAAREVRGFLDRESPIAEAWFVLFSPDALAAFERQCARYHLLFA